MGSSSDSVKDQSLILRIPSPTSGLLAQILGAAANFGAKVGAWN